MRRRAGSGSGWLVGQVVAMAPRLRVRDQAALQEHFRGMSADEIADTLIEGAAHAAAAAGAGPAAVAVLPVLPAFPAEVAAETLLVVGIELKLVAELHEAYGIRAPGNFAERMSAYLAALEHHRRGVFMVEGGVILAAGSPLARLLRRRLIAGQAGVRCPWARCSPAPPWAPCSTAGRPESSAGTSGATCAAVRSATEGGRGHIGSLVPSVV